MTPLYEPQNRVITPNPAMISPRWLEGQKSEAGVDSCWDIYTNPVG